MHSSLALPVCPLCSVPELYPLPAPCLCLPLVAPTHCKQKKNPSKAEFLCLRQGFPRQLFFSFFTSMSFTLMEILENHASAKYKKVFDFFTMFVPEAYERNPFFSLQNSFPMRTIQESLKTVIPCTLIKRLVCLFSNNRNQCWLV